MSEKEEYTVMVTGSRHLHDYSSNDIQRMLETVLFSIYRRCGVVDVPMRVICGDANGVDLETFKFCVKHEIPISVFLATAMDKDSKKKYTTIEDNYDLRHGSYKKVYVCVPTTNSSPDYHERDNCMMDMSHEMVAICINGSSGTKRNIKRAENENKKVSKIFLPKKDLKNEEAFIKEKNKREWKKNIKPVEGLR